MRKAKVIMSIGLIMFAITKIFSNAFSISNALIDFFNGLGLGLVIASSIKLAINHNKTRRVDG